MAHRFTAIHVMSPRRGIWLAWRYSLVLEPNDSLPFAMHYGGVVEGATPSAAFQGLLVLEGQNPRFDPDTQTPIHRRRKEK